MVNPKHIYIGQLDTRITIIQRERTTSSTGEKTVKDIELGAVWAKVEDVNSSEDIEGKIIALNVRLYTIRYDPALVTKQITDLYINHNNEQFNIHSVAYIGRKQHIQLKCSKRE